MAGGQKFKKIASALLVLPLAGCSFDGVETYWQEGDAAAFQRCQDWLDSGQQPAHQWVASGKQLLSFNDSRVMCEPDPSRRVATAWQAAPRKQATHKMAESQIGPFNSVEFVPLPAP